MSSSCIICQNPRRPGVDGLGSRSPYPLESPFNPLWGDASPPSTFYALPTNEKRTARRGGEGALR